MNHARLTLTLALLGAAPPAAAAPETAARIAEDALDANLLSASNAQAELSLDVSKDGEVVRRRRIVTKIRRGDDETRSLVEFLAPADVAGTKFLSVEAKGGDTQQYIFLPAFKKVKRVVGAQRTRSFMGTDFSYADLEGRDVRDATWTRLDDGEVGGQPVMVVAGTPKDPKAEQYGRIVVHVHEKHRVPMRIDFFDAADPETLVKRFSVRRLEKKGDRWLATDSVMESPKKGTATRMRVEQVDLGAELSDAELSRAALER